MYLKFYHIYHIYLYIHREIYVCGWLGDFPDLSSIDKLKELLNSNHGNQSKTVTKFIINFSILKNQST